MRHRVRAAGRALGALLAALALWQSPPAAAAELVTPAQIITGGRLAERTDANGMPLPGALHRFANFVFPAAVAARGPDVYVADSGARRVYRFDLSLQVLSVVPGVEALLGTRLQTAADQSLLVLDPARSRILRIGRGGRPLQSLSDSIVTARWSEFAADESGARLVASDRLNQRLVALQPLAGMSHPLSTAGESGGALLSPGAVAFAGRAILVADGACHCIVEVDENGAVRRQFGGEILKQPRALAADRHGRLFVLDGFDRSLHVFQQGRLVDSLDATRLRMVEPVALAVDGPWLYVADGPGARIGVFRLAPPETERQ
jgi:sugar lactone lactonase YvrE